MTKQDMWTLTKHKEWAALETWLPEIQAMRGVVQDPIHHAEGDVATHTQLVLASLTALPEYALLSPDEQEMVWTAALFHDIEKRSTTVVEPDGRITSAGHARRGESTTRDLLYRTIPTPFAIREQISKLVRYHGLPLWIFDKPDPLKALLLASQEVDLQLLTILATADVLGRVCSDQADMLYRVQLFGEYARDNQCWGQARPFSSGLSRFEYFNKTDRSPDYDAFDETVCEVVVLAGLPGTGKDTYLARHMPDWPVISLDNFRRKLRIDPTDRQGTGYVVQLAKEEAKAKLRSRTPFVWNATNLTRQLRQQLIDLFASYRARIKLVYLEVPYSQLVQQNRNREYAVPDDALLRLINRVEIPARWEAHEVVYEITE